ncbi:MAG: hypothetical protein R3C44_12840 [Chloroflexota bacterium]
MVPGPEMNSWRVIAAHRRLERCWIGDIAGQEPSGRVRAEEFRVTGATSAICWLCLMVPWPTAGLCWPDWIAASWMRCANRQWLTNHL